MDKSHATNPKLPHPVAGTLVPENLDKIFHGINPMLQIQNNRNL